MSTNDDEDTYASGTMGIAEFWDLGYSTFVRHRKPLSMELEMNWQPIETAPKKREPFSMFVVIAIETSEASPNITYTSDPYCVWRESDGSFTRWPHPFPPTHWFPLPSY